MSTSLVLRPINALLAERFVVPSYQRGYRWTERQVTELLEDIHEFQRNRHERPRETFYCLQPMVVLPREDGSWELIDGQQRLTTISLVLGFLSDLARLIGKGRYGVSYDTRKQSEAFLERPSVEHHLDNIDFFHMYRAFEAIRKWFDGRDGTMKLDFLNCLLAPEDRNVKVIWYQLPRTEDPIQVFIRLNVGKIPLTNSELIRAIFLRDRNFNGPSAMPSRIQIAQEWDMIEKRLQDDTFWYFIHEGSSPYPARIEYLFAIKVLELGLDIPTHDAYGTFIAYQCHFLQGRSVNEAWKKIRQLELRLEEWFSDRTLYHLVGYWIATSSSPSTEVVVKLLKKRRKRSRTDFECYVKGLIFKDFAGQDLKALSGEQIAETVSQRIGDLTYSNSDRASIRAVLLLFNVATLLRNSGSNLRFPFDMFKKERWDIEHIRSVKSDMPGRRDDMKEWLNQVMDYWKAQAGRTSPLRDRLREQTISLLSAESLDTGHFVTLYERILDYFEENDSTEADHSIANLALLDESTNRSYKNAVFPVKRARILELDKEGTFVPLCTTNVFLKYYSTEIDQMMFWREDDGERYQSAVIETLVHFFTGDRA